MNTSGVLPDALAGVMRAADANWTGSRPRFRVGPARLRQWGSLALGDATATARVESYGLRLDVTAGDEVCAAIFHEADAQRGREFLATAGSRRALHGHLVHHFGGHEVVGGSGRAHAGFQVFDWTLMDRA